jgi:cytochrome c peroxidase
MESAMRTPRVPLLSLVAALAVIAGACTKEPPAPPVERPKITIDPSELTAFAPLPDSVPAADGVSTDDMVSLGRMLFFDPRLSKSQKISCNSCHDLATYGVDNQPTSDGHKGQVGTRNSPTVFNAAGHFAQFWDGRAADVEEQAKGPVLNPVEMAMPAEPVVVKVLESMPEYVQAFEKAFPNDKKKVSYDNMAKAIGAFERKLLTPSRWDKFLKGDHTALTPEEQAGFKVFNASGCGTCHAGALLGGSFYQKMGAVKPFPRSADTGREKVTKNAADEGMFKVPSLRNVEKTAPYFHDGQTPGLDQAVRDMGEYQLGRALTTEDTRQIIDFLRVLTGTIDPEFTRPPALPHSTAKTPKPDER